MTDNIQPAPQNPHCDRSWSGIRGLPHYMDDLQRASSAACALAHMLRADCSIHENVTVHSHTEEEGVPLDGFTRAGLHDAMVVVAQVIAGKVEAAIENWGNEYHRSCRGGGAQ